MYPDHGWIMKRAEITPDSTALVDVHTGQRWSYGELAVRTASRFLWPAVLSSSAGSSIRKRQSGR